MPQFDSRTTRMPLGLTNAAPWQTFGAAGFPDPSFAQVFHTDFDTYTSAAWTATVVGTGTQALADADGGQLLVSNTAGATDATYLKLANATFKVTPGKFLLYKFIGTLSDIANCTSYYGLVQKSATTKASITDGIFLSNDAANTGTLTLNVVVGSAAVTAALPSTASLTAGTPFELGIVVDALGNVGAYFNPGTGRAAISTPVAGTRGPAAVLYAPALPTALLTPSFGLLNASATTRTLSVDCLTVARER